MIIATVASLLPGAASSLRFKVDLWGRDALRLRVLPAAVASDPAVLNATGYLLLPPPESSTARGPSSSSNLRATVTDGRACVERVSDAAALLCLSESDVAVGPAAGPHDPSRRLAATLDVPLAGVDRWFGGGCRCGGGYTTADHPGGGAMVNVGANSTGIGPLRFGVPMGHDHADAPPGVPGGVGSQCGMMNGMPWLVAAASEAAQGRAPGASFGVFVNTVGWVAGTATPADGDRHAEIRVEVTRATHLDFYVATFGADAVPDGSVRADALAGRLADALGHVPPLPESVAGYWHSKDSIASQAEAESTVAGFRERGLKVDVLVLDFLYKVCDGCTDFNPATFPDPTALVSGLRANGTYVMAHVNIEQNFSMIHGGSEFLERGWAVTQRGSNKTASSSSSPSSAHAPTPLCRAQRGGLGNSWDTTTCRYDPSDPDARRALWASVNASLVRHGVHMFWLDGDEIIGEDPWETPTAPLDPLAAPERPAGPGTCTLYEGVEFEFADIGAASGVGSAHACCAACQANPDCYAFTWAVGGSCALKSEVWRRAEGRANRTSGVCDGRVPRSPFVPLSDGPAWFRQGPNRAVGTLYPLWHQQTFREGIERSRLPEPAMTLSRSTTAGSWRLGGASWDGDHNCTWDDYLGHFHGSLDAQLSGQLLWSYDTGGFFCQMDEETMCRDFILAATSPLFRQHGARDTRIWAKGWTPAMTRAASAAIRLRDSLRGYVAAEMATAADTGRPLQRYLWWDWPQDANVWTVFDQFMFGTEYMVAPVIKRGAVEREVYFPQAGKGKAAILWQHVSTGKMYEGGTTAVVPVPLDDLAMFRRLVPPAAAAD